MTIRTLYPPTQMRNITTLAPLVGQLVYFFFLGGEVGGTTSSNVTIPVVDLGEGPAPLSPYF